MGSLRRPGRDVYRASGEHNIAGQPLFDSQTRHPGARRHAGTDRCRI
jgi:hypothetical protein